MLQSKMPFKAGALEGFIKCSILKPMIAVITNYSVYGNLYKKPEK